MALDYAAAYGELHQLRDGKYFPGQVSDKVPWNKVRDLVRSYRPARILDYGSGKGYQYLAARVHETWGGPVPHCYDVGVRQLRDRPTGRFGGLICFDMLEHIESADVDGIIADIFSFVDDETHAFAVFDIGTTPSKSKLLPDGRNVHLTVESPRWWRAKLAKYARPGLVIASYFDGGEA